jgi:hypothetical protein
MDENKVVQLKREEIIDQDNVLSDIFPITTTDSVLNNESGDTLSKTLARVMNLINNKISRVVNSVNGRSGAVVIDKNDVGLGNVDNVSFDDIKRWVISQLTQSFSKHTIKLFNNLHEAALFAENHDQTYSGTPFFSDKGYVDSSVEFVDNKSYIGYFEYDTGSNILVMYYRPINVIGSTDNSIIYNTNVKGDFRGGKIGINIYKYEDALKIWNHASGETATDSTLRESGLYIDKNKIAPILYAFDGCYGLEADTTDVNALLYLHGSEPSSGAIGVTMVLNGETICSNNDTFVRQSFKINDLILCNFNDANYYDDNDGSLKTGVDQQLILRQPTIGRVVQAPTMSNPSTPYRIEFYSIKPFLGFGLTYKHNHTESGQTPDNMLSISPLKGSTDPNADSDTVYDISGFVMFNNNARELNGSMPSIPTYYMSTMSGIKQMIHSDTKNGIAINPASSMCIIPFDNSDMDLDNVPTNTPTNTWDTGRYIGGYIGINLMKSILSVNNSLKGNNISGLRINDSIDVLAPEWFGNPELDYESLVHSGGLSVNVGDFLEIGNSINDILPDVPPSLQDYYNSGKVNVRVDNETIGNIGNNIMGVKLSNYVNYTQKDLNHALGGGLIYTEGFNSDDPSANLSISKGITINRGLGMRISHYDRFGNIPDEYIYTLLTSEPENFNPIDYFKKDQYDDWVRGHVGDVWATDTWYTRTENIIPDHGFLTTSIIDTQYTDADVGMSTDSRQRGYGGLRYFIGDSSVNNQSFIGLRVNPSTSNYGHENRIGSKAIGIDEQNVVQVQRYRETADEYMDTNPVVIQGWDEPAIYPYVHIKGLRKNLTVDTPEDLPGESRNPYGIPRSYITYYVKSTNKHYVWDSTLQEYKPQFTLYDQTTQGEWNRVYVEQIIDNVNHTYIGRAYKWDTGYYAKLPFSYNSSTGEYEDDAQYKVDAVTASKVLAYYAAQSTRDEEGSYDGYYYQGEFYTTMGHQVIIQTSHEEGSIYFDITTEYPEVAYKYEDGVYKPYTTKPGTTTSVSHEDLIACDVNNDGIIDSSDTSIFLRFYAFMSTAHPEYPQFDNLSNRDALSLFMELFFDEPERGPAYKIIHGTDPDGSFMPGLDVNVNENQGLTTRLNGDIRNSISVKIYDSSSGNNVITENNNNPTSEYIYILLTSKPDNFNPVNYFKKDQYDNWVRGQVGDTWAINMWYQREENNVDVLYQGGLRFTTDGYLAVRVNDMHSYDATTSNGRISGDWCRPTSKQNYGPYGKDYGARGLMVYPNNVLGIQLGINGELDNGELSFDEYGSLHISPQYINQHVHGETLTFTDQSGNTVSYNGSSPTNILLGPGLIIEEIPDENDEP